MKTEPLSSATHTRALPMNPHFQPLRRVVPGNHNFYTHFPKEPSCEVCQKDQNCKGSLAENVLAALPYLERRKFWRLDITADHKILSKGFESRNNHRYAIVVQDLAPQWVQSYPCKTKTSQETERSLQKFLEPTRKQKVIFTDNYLQCGKACEDL